jgi:AmmeMemoRadiSam system protein B
VIGWITSGDWETLIDAAESRRISSCGAGCVAAILLINDKIGGKITVLKQGSSLPVVKDPKRVVHYAAFTLVE